MPSSVNHPLHIVLCLLSGGLWLFVYAFILWEDDKQRKHHQAVILQTRLHVADAETAQTLAEIAAEDPALAASLRAELEAARAEARAAGVDPAAMLLAHEAAKHR
jgi:hypothetical protein